VVPALHCDVPASRFVYVLQPWFCCGICWSALPCLCRDRIRCATSLAKACAVVAGAAPAVAQGTQQSDQQSTKASNAPSSSPPQAEHAQLVISLLNAYSAQCMQDELHTITALRKQQRAQQPKQQQPGSAQGIPDHLPESLTEQQPGSVTDSSSPAVAASDVATPGPEGVAITGSPSGGPWARLHEALISPDVPLVPTYHPSPGTHASSGSAPAFVTGWHLRLVCRTILQASYAAEQQLSQQRNSAAARARGLGRSRRKPAGSNSPTGSTNTGSHATSQTAATQLLTAAATPEKAAAPTAVAKAGSQEQGADPAADVGSLSSSSTSAAATAPLPSGAATTTTAARPAAKSQASQQPFQVPDLLSVDGVSVCDPVFVMSYVNWYKTCRDLDASNFNQ
jgi:hypothetical protein